MIRDMDQLEGIAGADALLGRAFPLPALPLPLARWVDVVADGTGAEVRWSLDDSREGAPGRLALYAGADPGAQRDAFASAQPRRVDVRGVPAVLREAPLADAQPSLRPVFELAWRAGELHLRLTAQGPWSVESLVDIAASIDVEPIRSAPCAPRPRRDPRPTLR